MQVLTVVEMLNGKTVRHIDSREPSYASAPTARHSSGGGVGMARPMQRLAIVLPRGEEFEATVYDNWRWRVNPPTLRSGPPTRRRLATLEQIMADLVASHAHEVLHGGSPIEPIAGLVVERYLPSSRSLWTAEPPPIDPNVEY